MPAIAPPERPPLLLSVGCESVVWLFCKIHIRPRVSSGKNDQLLTIGPCRHTDSLLRKGHTALPSSEGKAQAKNRKGTAVQHRRCPLPDFAQVTFLARTIAPLFDPAERLQKATQQGKYECESTPVHRGQVWEHTNGRSRVSCSRGLRGGCARSCVGCRESARHRVREAHAPRETNVTPPPPLPLTLTRHHHHHPHTYTLTELGISAQLSEENNRLLEQRPSWRPAAPNSTCSVRNTKPRVGQRIAHTNTCLLGRWSPRRRSNPGP